MGRICEYPECTTPLNDRVSLHITLCGVHQRELRLLRERLSDENFPETDILFIATHPEECSVSQLSDHLVDISKFRIRYYLEVGRIKGYKRGSPSAWRIPIEEIIRVIILFRNWIKVTQAARDIGVDEHLLLAYAREGHFSCKEYLCGSAAIRKNELPGLRVKIEAIRQRNLDPKNKLGNRGYRRDEELLPGEIQRIVGLRCLAGVHVWIEKGWLVAKRREPLRKRSKKAGKWLVVKWSDFLDFAQKAVAGEYPVRSRTKRALKEFLSQQNPSSLKLRRINPP